MITDYPVLKLHNNEVEINQGRRFPLKKSYLLYLFLFMVLGLSFLLPFSSLSIGFQLISVLLILFLFTANTGLILREDNVCFYVGAFFLRHKAWKRFDSFTCIVIKTSRKKRENTIVNIIGDSATVKESFTTTELYFMNSTHRKKIFCCSFESLSDAKIFAIQLSEQVNFPIEKFAPVLSKVKR